MNNNSYTTYPTHIATWDDCRYKYYLRYILKVMTSITSANLVFGKTIHSILEQIIIHVDNDQSFDAENEFNQLWQSATAEEVVEYSSRMSNEDLTLTGAFLVNQFQEKWKELELSPLIDSNNNLFVEKKLTTQITPDLHLGAILDFAGINTDNEVIILDFKTPAAIACDEHVVNDNQILAQQIVLDHHKKEYGIKQVDRIGFLDLMKKKMPVPNKSGKFSKNASWPTVNDPKTIDRRNAQAVADFKQKLIWMKEDRDRGRFPKTPRSAYNTPCSLCDYAEYCTTGSTEGLIFPKEHNQVKLVS